MALERRACGTAIHATAVAVQGRALLIRGASKTGKSGLAAALVAASTASLKVELIGDDRVILVLDRAGRTLVRPHPRIAGFLERRGLGIVAMPFLDEAPLAAVVDLDHATRKYPDPANFPVLRLVNPNCACHRKDRVMAWWSTRVHAAERSHSVDNWP